MVDVKWQNGDLVTDSTGNVVMIGGTQAQFQRALLRMTVPRGSFIYDRELGVRRLTADSGRTELLLNEALARCPGMRVRVTAMGNDSVTVEMQYGGESCTREVREYGDL